MERRSYGHWTLAAFMLLASTAIAQDSPLTYFGDQVDVLIRFREPDRSLENIGSLVNRIQPGFGDLARTEATNWLGRAISSPHLTGVDQSRDWYVGVYLSSDADPVLVFAIPAITAEDLIAGLDEEMTTEVRDSYVLYTESEALPAVAGSADAKLTGETRAAFEKGDVGFYVDAARLTPLYADTIESGRDRALELLNQLRFLPPDEGVNVEALIQMLGALADRLFQAIEDSRSLAVSLGIQERELEIEEYATFAEGSKTSAFLARRPPVAMPQLAQLPDGGAIYVGLGAGTKSMTRWALKLVEGTAEDEDDQSAALQKSLDEMTFGPSVSSFHFDPTTEHGAKFLVLLDAAPQDKLQAIARFGLELKESETIAGRTVDVGTLKSELEQDPDDENRQQRMARALFGERGMEQRIAYLDGGYAWSMGGGEAAMAELLARVDAKSSNPQFASQVEPANVIALVDLPTLIAESMRASARDEESFIPVDEQMIDSLNLQPSYIRFTATSGPTSVRLQTRVSTDQMLGIAKVALLVRSVVGAGF